MLLPARHIRAMGSPGSPQRHKPWAARATGTLACPIFSTNSLYSNFWVSRQSFPSCTPPVFLHQRAALVPGVPWAPRPSPGVEPCTSSSCLAPAPVLPHWQIIKPRQTLSCTPMVLSFTLFIWNCMARLAIRIASGSSHSKPPGDFAHNKTLYQNQFSAILIFFPPTWAGKRSSAAHRITLQQI